MPLIRSTFRPWLIAAILSMLVAVPVIGATQEAPPDATPEPETGPQFVLHPVGQADGTYFTLEAEAGSTHSLEVVLGNADTEPLTLRTYVADAFSPVNGGFATHEESEPITGPATWISYPPETVTIEPESGIQREFSVTVPEGTAPGEYIAGLVLETTEPLEIEGSAMFDQIARKTIAVFIIVPGETSTGVELGDPEIQSSIVGDRLVIPVRNTGNVLVKPAGDVTLTDGSGAAIFTQQVAMGSVYAGFETTLELPLPTALSAGEYHLSVVLNDEETSAEASIDQVALTLERSEESDAPLVITSASVTPTPNAEDVQFATVALTVSNTGAPIQGAQVTLHVERDGSPVEDFVLANAVTLQQGETTLEQRYIPIEGWSAGEWSFSLTLSSVSPETGATTQLLIVDVEQTLTIFED